MKNYHNTRDLRKKFYGWMSDSNYLKLLVSRGMITEDEIKKKGFRNRDLGECELIAIAKTAVDEYQIVTNDKGRVFLHPKQNLFDDYAADMGLTVLSSEEWLNKIGYEASDQYLV